MLTIGNLKNRLDALSQLRRFDPDIVVLVDGAPVTSVHVSTHRSGETGRETLILELSTKPA